jgi:MFS family permease
MFLPAIGGYYIDHYDPKKTLFILSLTILLGQFLFNVGIYLKNIHLVIFGRFVFGIGGECISVSESAIISRWFQ